MPKFDINELKRLYLEEKLTYAKIGRRLGYTKQHVGKILKDSGIQTRGRYGYKLAIDEDTLNKLYVDEGRTMQDIAKRTGHMAQTVSKYLDRYQIPKRSDRFRDAYPKLRKLKVGQSFKTRGDGSRFFYNRFYNAARKAGMQVSIKSLSGLTIRITRVK